jgi:hypothetical protein
VEPGRQKNDEDVRRHRHLWPHLCEIKKKERVLRERLGGRLTAGVRLWKSRGRSRGGLSKDRKRRSSSGYVREKESEAEIGKEAGSDDEKRRSSKTLEGV